jgi:hypothetical protein
MTRNGRIDKLERALQPESPPMSFTFCKAPEGLSPAEHDAWHRANGDGEVTHFTLDLGHCSVRTD